MTTKRFVGRMVMVAALAVMTAGVMPAPYIEIFTGGDARCRTASVAAPNIHTFDEQSSIGNPFDLMWTWFENVVLPIL